MINTKTASSYAAGRVTRLALLVAMNCISAYIIIPIPFSQSPIALQTLIVDLVAYLLPPRQAALVMGVYVAIGMIGVPVFTGGSAGPGKMFGPTGGYIWGYILAVAVVSFAKGKVYNFRRYALAGALLGLPIINGLGCLQLKLVTGMSWEAAFLSGVLPFIPLDIAKCLGAAALARPLRRALGYFS